MEEKVTGLTKEISEIRKFIKKLEEVKDEIILFYNSSETLNPSMKSMWTADIKEVYYNILASWQMLDASLKDNIYAFSSENFLKIAACRREQVMSELKSIKTPELELKLKDVFQACVQEISKSLKQFIPEKEITPPACKIIKINQGEYHLPCSLCSHIAVVFRIGTSKYEKTESLIYEGICHLRAINREHEEKIFNRLERKEIYEVHSYLEKTGVLPEGIDAFCPDCDKIYCRNHYNVTEEWDEGYYDCSYGICPKGHRRMIDD